MLIRPATPADVPAVLPMVAKICAVHESWDADKYGFLPQPEKRYQRWLTRLANQEGSVFLVAENRGQLVAFVAATVEQEIPIYRTKEFGFIHDIWVEPEYRQQGIAKQIVELTIERFRQMGVEQIRLDTAAINEAARKLFISCGFRLSTMEMLITL
ncbi:Acetyltransferase, GNAT family [Trichormus variabilis ATCC 29413]|uniref:Acetyltransferase, GNAT family n=2 Tax=Anabaena variabilis TaxID=264691 RepID=Q3MFC3_TRIV2|nr:MULTISPECIES: GNAT family N-acetyltransferase [Nostocaceae]ABA20313.1 Acetyltransferase, GNAT family [Trichormus variabilis ATCC 29413]MBC1212710.1 GNAT family N-acetyltransferase [Trichormus variabilis ARAD]MBC1254536.1 GNAT family N-acetyltransferase [Trichormus variabilis V5]MBC1265811.1 GNAT family N-acetyltransferase [Trichormus variabilis FSR]MBC1300622.1 GNAT family N-acetyltransferase [Trichormus variabilis N2B]